MVNNENLNFIKSKKLFVLVLFIVSITFVYFDILIFELSKSVNSIVFIFFRNVIDPLSDFFDPLNIILFCILIIFINLNVSSILKNDLKLKALKKRTNFTLIKINSSFNLINLICRHFIFSLATAGILCNIFKYILGVSRPKYFLLQGYDRINPFNLEHKVNSFPSGHTQAAFTIAILIILYTNRYTLIILIFAIFMGVSRIFMSMHFPSDLIFGAYIGSLTPILIFDWFYKDKIEKILKSNKISLSDLGKLMYNRMFI